MRLAMAPGAIASLGVHAPSFSRKPAFAGVALFGLRAFDMGGVNRAGPGRPAERRVTGSRSYFCASTASAIALAPSSAVIFGLFTKDVMVSRIAPRYFCRMVML